jgi:hypothetical protein
VLAAIAAGILVAEQFVSTGDRSGARGAAQTTGSPVTTGGAPPVAAQRSSQHSASSPPPETVGAADLEQAVSEYYALLPEHTDRSWVGLGPGLREQGKRGYERFWKRIRKVEVLAGPRAVGERAVRVVLEFTVKKRGVVRELHRLGMVVDGERALIDSDQLVWSRAGSSGDGHKGDDEDDGAGKGD